MNRTYGDSVAAERAERAAAWQRLIVLLDEIETQVEFLTGLTSDDDTAYEARGIALDALTEARQIVRKLEDEQ